MKRNNHNVNRKVNKTSKIIVKYTYTNNDFKLTIKCFKN